VARQISSYGLSLTPPSGWDATIYVRPAAPGEQTFPVVHAATVPLASGRGDYGGGLVETLGPDDVFVSVLEFGPEAVGTPLFSAVRSVPTLTPGAFKTNQLQRMITGQAGVQRFFTVAGRAFCLYTVLGAFAHRIPLTSRANMLIGTLAVAPA
jgi:hypothetical protein